jgi:hypothetical protein
MLYIGLLSLSNVNVGFRQPPDWEQYFHQLDNDPGFKEKELEKLVKDFDKHLRVMQIK